MLVNDRNEARYVHLKEILEVMQAEINFLGKYDSGSSREQIEVSPMDEFAIVQCVNEGTLCIFDFYFSI